MLIAEEFLLLCLDDETGKKLVGTERIDPALGGALLAELALMERIGVTPESDGWTRRGRVSIVSDKPTDDPELDRALGFLVEHEGRKVKDLVSGMSLRPLTKGLRDRLLARLAAAGVLTEEKASVLAVFPTTRWPTADPGPEGEVRSRLRSALVDGLTPTERTVPLVALLQATDLLVKAVPSEDKLALKARAKRLSDGDWAAKAVKQAIEEVTSAAAVVAMAGAASAGDG